MTKENKKKAVIKEQSNDIPATHAAGFRIQAGDDTIIPTTGVAPTPAPVVENKDYEGSDIVKQINEADDNIKFESTITMTDGDVTINAPNVTIESDDELNRLVDETLRGVHGSGRERMIALGENYSKVQQEIVRRIRKEHI